MRTWFDQPMNANKLRQSYLRGFLDISGGGVYLRSDNSMNFFTTADGANPTLSIGPTMFKVTDGASAMVDVSNSSLSKLAGLYENVQDKFRAIDTTFSNMGQSTTVTSLDANNLNVANRLVVGGDATFQANLDVAGNETVGKDLVVKGDTLIDGSLSVLGDISLGTWLQVGGEIIGLSDASINGHLFVGSDASLNAKLYVAQDAKMNAKLLVSGDVSMNSKLFVSGDVSMNSKLAVASDASFGGDMDIAGTLRVQHLIVAGQEDSTSTTVTFNQQVIADNGLVVTGDVSLNNRLNVAQAAQFNSTMNVAQAATLQSTLNVANKITAQNDLSLNGKLFVGGDASLNSKLAVAGAAALASTLSVAQDATLQSKLFVSSDASLNSKLYVGGATTMDGTLTANGGITASSLTVSNATIANGTVTMNDGLTVATGDVSLNHKLTVGQDASFNAKISVGGEATFASKIIAKADASFNGKVAIAGDVSMGSKLDVADTISAPHLIGSTDANIGSIQILQSTIKVTDSTYANGNLVLTPNGSGIVHLTSGLKVDGDINFTGNFTRTDTLVSVTNEFDISNNGTGPALKVTQWEADTVHTVASFYSQNKMVMDIGSYGVVAIGKAAPQNSLHALDISGAVAISGTFDVSGNAAFGANMSVVGDYSSTNGNITLTNGTAHVKFLTVDAAATFSDDITVAGKMTINGADGLTVANAATIGTGLTLTAGDLNMSTAGFINQW
jgi:predicted acyltransferase (DUF342 family)